MQPSRLANSDDPANWEHVLMQGAWYLTLAPDLRRDLLAEASIRKIPGGQRLFRRGDRPRGMYVVLEGTIRISAFTGTADNAQEMLMVPMPPGVWFGEISLFDDGPMTHDAYPVEDARVLHIPILPLKALLERTPIYWRSFGQLMASKTRMLFQTSEDLMAMPMKARIAYRILQLASGFSWLADNSVAPGCVVQIAQMELAMMLGCTRQTVNQLLSEMQDENWIVLKRGTIVVLNPGSLLAHARGEM